MKIQNAYSRAASDTSDRASAFQQNHIAPDMLHFADPLPPSDFPEAMTTMQNQADGVFREYPRLKCPDALAFRKRNDGPQQSRPNPLPSWL